MSGSFFATEADTPPVDWFAGTIPGTTQNADPNAAGVAGSSGIAYGTGTGQLGQVLSGSNAMDTDGASAVLQWLNTPFKTPLSTVSVVLLVGIVLVAIVGWNFVLYHIRIAAETI